MTSPSRPSRPGTGLTAELVAELRNDIAAGDSTITEWAARLGMSWSAVEKAAYGRTWRSVTDPAPLTAPPPPQEPPPSFARLTPRIVARMLRPRR
ncbi:hypothetical protein AN218_05560 [Streptomyces nanshensis]|uniref:Uncharacterized protein n=1 Tax=Streptomyces nanshensis TaxID=518642 RepID=A0A1E7L9U0_9ACTN|nr:hypothetical protein AN218_05560 [Streptomyces nanshensis]